MLQEMRQRKDRFYEAKRVEMKEFKETADNFLVKCQLEVENLKNRVNEVSSN